MTSTSEAVSVSQAVKVRSVTELVGMSSRTASAWSPLAWWMVLSRGRALVAAAVANPVMVRAVLVAFPVRTSLFPVRATPSAGGYWLSTAVAAGTHVLIGWSSEGTALDTQTVAVLRAHRERHDREREQAGGRWTQTGSSSPVPTAARCTPPLSPTPSR